jgi:pimeloyl-ACP methyl ester carboxylesterase
VIQPLVEHGLTLAGYKTRVLELEGDGVPIVMFHGYADSADTWRQCLALLARGGQRAVAVDLPGFGEADPLLPDPILPQLDAFAAEAVAYAAGRPRQPVMVVGNSLGGCVSIRLAERHVRRLGGVGGGGAGGTVNESPPELGGARCGSALDPLAPSYLRWGALNGCRGAVAAATDPAGA